MPRSGNRRLVEGDHRVAERDHEQQPREADIWSSACREASIIRMPCQLSTMVANDRNMPQPDAQELRLVREQQARDGLLHGGDRVVAELRRHAATPLLRCRE